MVGFKIISKRKYSTVLYSLENMVGFKKFKDNVLNF